MKVKSLLAQAGKCQSQADADKLLETLQRAFGNARSLAHLPIANEESYMEGDKPFVHFELNREISEHYITMIRPEIRDGSLVVAVVTNHMLDGLGMGSQNWEGIDGMDIIIETRSEQTVAEIARLAAKAAIADHKELIARVGVPEKVARQAAAKSW